MQDLQVTSADPQVTTLPYYHGILGVRYNGSQNAAIVTDGSRTTSLDPRYASQFWPWTPYDEPLISSGGVVNAASFQGNNLAPGGIYSAFGLKLTSEHALVVQAYPLPQNLSRAQVRILGADGQTYLCPLYYVGGTQINFQVPYAVPIGPATLTVTTGITPSNQAAVTIADADPGIFQEGGGLGAVLHAATYQPVTASSPAKPGEYILIYWTGGGAMTPSVPAGTAVTSLAATDGQVSVSFGTQAVTAYWSGLAPGFSGLYQTNVLVPQLPSGQANLSITLDGG